MESPQAVGAAERARSVQAADPRLLLDCQSCPHLLRASLQGPGAGWKKPLYLETRFMNEPNGWKKAKESFPVSALALGNSKLDILEVLVWCQRKTQNSKLEVLFRYSELPAV